MWLFPCKSKCFNRVFSSLYKPILGMDLGHISHHQYYVYLHLYARIYIYTLLFLCFSISKYIYIYVYYTYLYIYIFIYLNAYIISPVYVENILSSNYPWIPWNLSDSLGARQAVFHTLWVVTPRRVQEKLW